ncbi:bifunctional riboflavin kinase/FAD synthetase [Microbacterium sp. LRZ72]|uniref:bifunctional riboflavin kinase/FAD synthetase n=1 Tax=Microbacterium sp. LRZ72 TaxID=2942481 RepID=UPI0029ADB820|nr:bifunctional riboflavin kinase/FAD synthetase [Microbacterium sp. LRZ72]MDX2377398.1 bifunctional riboflavin kinase/FAD synthetase [Microbacterium sp. LRZ72]
MMLYTDPGEIPADFGESVVAIGKFDGLHAGHRAIIERMLVDAAGTGARTVAVTFDRNPLAVLAPLVCPRALVGTRQKAALLEDTGIDATLMLRFDETLAAEPAEDFVRRILRDALHARTVLVGTDFRFGQGGRGDAALLRRMGEEYGFRVDEIDDIRSLDGRRVSSTWIRELLDEGSVADAAKLLGRPPAVWGEVVHGAKRGRELGYPTANLTPDLDGFIPADGVYAGWLIDTPETSGPAATTRYPAAISVGDNPTFTGVAARQVEAHVLDAGELDLYGHDVAVQFVERIRGMVAFRGIEALKDQMADDVTRARTLLE